MDFVDFDAMMMEEFGDCNRTRNWASLSPPHSPPAIRKIQERLSSPERGRKSPEVIEQNLTEKMVCVGVGVLVVAVVVVTSRGAG